jgi:hypothetical protein
MFKELAAPMEFEENMDNVIIGITEFAMPGDGKFNCPTDKKRTKQATEAMIKAENNLDLFWGKFDRNWRKVTGKSVDMSMGKHIPKRRGMVMERTQPWVEPIKEPASK